MGEPPIMNTPAHIKQVAASVIDNLLPEKSSHRYLKEYEQFMKWCGENAVSDINEYALLAYFKLKSESLKYSTLWSIYSMLKSTINVKHNINIEKYTKLIAFLKKMRSGYVPKKSRTLEIEDIQKFITDAPDEDYLMLKVGRVALIHLAVIMILIIVLGSLNNWHVCGMSQTRTVNHESSGRSRSG